MRKIRVLCRALCALALVAALCCSMALAAKVVPVIEVKDGVLTVTFDTGNRNLDGKLMYQLVNKDEDVVAFALHQSAEWLPECYEDGEYKACVYYVDANGYTVMEESEWTVVAGLGGDAAQSVDQPAAAPAQMPAIPGIPEGQTIAMVPPTEPVQQPAETAVPAPTAAPAANSQPAAMPPMPGMMPGLVPLAPVADVPQITPAPTMVPEQVNAVDDDGEEYTVYTEEGNGVEGELTMAAWVDDGMDDEAPVSTGGMSFRELMASGSFVTPPVVEVTATPVPAATATPAPTALPMPEPTQAPAAEPVLPPLEPVADPVMMPVAEPVVNEAELMPVVDPMVGFDVNAMPEVQEIVPVEPELPVITPVPAAPAVVQGVGELFLLDVVEDEKGFVTVSWMDLANCGPYRLLYKRVNADGTTDNQVGWFYDEDRTTVTLTEMQPGSTYMIELRNNNNETCDSRTFTLAQPQPYEGIKNLKMTWSKLFNGDRMLDEPSAANLARDYNTQPYRLRCKYTFDNLRKVDSFSMLCVVTAPNGFEYAHQEDVVFKNNQTWTTWQWDVDYFLEVMVKEFGMIPAGEYTVSTYHDGEIMGTQTFIVK